MTPPLLPSQKLLRVCLFLIAAIAITGGTVQLSLGEPETTPRLDNVHRFMAGVYLSCGFLALWTAITIRQHDTLVFLLALAVFMGGTGRLISMSIVGIPEPHGLWLGYLVPELSLPVIIVIAQWMTNKKLGTKS